MWSAIENGAEFYFSEDDYIQAKQEDSWDSPPGMLVDVPLANIFSKHETPQNKPKRKAPNSESISASPTIKRPQRSVTGQKRSYAESEMSSSEESFELDSDAEQLRTVITIVKETQKAIETSLQLWIKHFKMLQKEEQTKVCLPIVQTTSR